MLSVWPIFSKYHLSTLKLLIRTPLLLTYYTRNILTKRYKSYGYTLEFCHTGYYSSLTDHHHHHVVPLARISLALSRHFSLSFIASGRSSGLHPVSSHSCWMYVHAGRPVFARPCVGVHKSTSLKCSSLLLQQCPACLVRLTVRTVGVLWGVAARICSRLLAAFLYNCRLASSPGVLLESM